VEGYIKLHSISLTSVLFCEAYVYGRKRRSTVVVLCCVLTKL